MKELKDKVAVITGGASGIGFSIARQAVLRGMKVVLADIEQAALDAAQGQLEKDGASVLAVKTDVTKPEQMQSLAKKTIETFGSVYLVVNNAGVGGVAGKFIESDLDTWKWVLNVNMWGVVNGLHTFAPILAEQNQGYIVNTGSVAGLMTAADMSAYTVSKHAVVALSEALYIEFEKDQIDVGVSVLCPSYVVSNINTSDRNRPNSLIDALSDEARQARDSNRDRVKDFVASVGMPASEVGAVVFDAIDKDEFYILTHPEGSRKEVKDRMQAILDGKNPPMKKFTDLPLDY
jgi:NAD(P)-dependent dehydrogenase (short-subunit alcohol dehydrogenase family)